MSSAYLERERMKSASIVINQVANNTERWLNIILAKVLVTRHESRNKVRGDAISLFNVTKSKGYVTK